jgi:hypothetical protein
MMKSILLATVLMVSAANAQETQFKWGGGLELEYESVENRNLTEEATNSDFVQTTKLHVDIIKSESLMGKITLRNVALWGSDRGFTGTETAYKSENVNENILIVEEAYGVWKLSEQGALQFGRGSFELNNGELVSKNGDGGVTPISFDGILYTHDVDAVRIGVFGVRAVDDGFNYAEHSYETSAQRGEAHFFGATFEVKTLPEFLNKLNLHYVGAKANDNTDSGITKNERSWIGLSTGGEVGVIDYSAAYENFEGEAGTIDREGDMFNVAAGFNMPEVKAMRFGLSYHQSSGEKGAGDNTSLADGKSKAYDSFNYDQKRYTGSMGLVRWGNGRSTTSAILGAGLEAIGVHFKMEPAEGMKVFADYFMFNTAEERNSEDELGQELDLGVEKTYANGFKTGLEYGMFTAGDFFGATGEDATRIAATIGFDF